ncbi:MAG: trypsin-like serine protease [Pyrinomonadaceae bacterium]|nr:trypsin-like serine protease [Pyrinomonadaceae bacterium]
MMNVKTYGRLFRIAVALLTVISCAAVGVAQNQENIGKVQQGLVNGSVTSPAEQEQYGLVTLTRGCSASLLRNNWVITAAHCIDSPNPARGGQFITVPEDSLTLRANWPSPQERKSVRIISLRPHDVAIIRVDHPFTVNGSSGAYNRDVWRDAKLDSLSIIVFGRGINQFAQGSGASATPSRGDGSFRIGLFTTSNFDGNYYDLSGSSQSISGGDSGGPSFANINGNVMLLGVHSVCEIECVQGQTCGKWPGPGPAPAGYTNWRWVSATPVCADAAIAPVWDDIDRYLGAFVPTRPEAVKSIGRTSVPIKSIGRDKGSTTPTAGPPMSMCDRARDARARKSPAADNLEAQCRALTGTPVGASRFPICDRARDARARKSPAADGLEAQCRALGGNSSVIPPPPPIDATQHDALAAKGKAIANQDPLSIELRNRESDRLSRLGFDVGMAAAEGQTQDGPNKKRIHDSLSPAEQSSFRTAVAFSLERNKNAAYATKGATIAELDSLVAEARTADSDVFYWLGFDIATGIFGDPALGAQGNTQTGPNSLGIRDGLSAAGQRGFNAAVKFHLGRDYRRPSGATVPRDSNSPSTEVERPNGRRRDDEPVVPGDSNSPSTEVERPSGSRRDDEPVFVRPAGRRRGEAWSNQILCRGSDDKIRLEGSDELHDLYFFRTISSRVDSTGAEIQTIELGGNTALVAAGSNAAGLSEGSCAWMDRRVDGGDRGVRIRFEVPANAQLNQARHGTPVDTSPTAAERFPDASNIPIYFRDVNHYWIFTVTDSRGDYLQATASRHWKRTFGLADEVTRPIDTRGAERRDRVLSPTRP